MNVRSRLPKPVKLAMVAVLLVLAADGRGTATPVLPLLAIVAMVSAARRSRTSALDRLGWKLGTAGLTCGFLAFGLMAAGLPLQHPVVVLLFVATYPLVMAMQVTFFRVRTLNSQLANYLDGAIIASLAAVAVIIWIVPQQQDAGNTGWRLFVGLLFPVLGVLAVGTTFTLGSVVKWRMPPILAGLFGAQICFLLSDVLPLLEDALGTSIGLGLRSAACAYLFVIYATQSAEEWSASFDPKRTSRVYYTVWGAALLSLVVLIAPGTALGARLFAGLSILLAGIRVTIAYSEATVATDLRIEARTDELTGLHNRRALRELLEELVRTNTSYSVLILDLDDFKVTNDTLGHDAGDQMLRTVAARLRRVARQSGDRVRLYRLGGDEFAMVVMETSEATLVAADVVKIIRVPTIIGGERIDQSVSIGIATFPSDATIPGDVLRLADAAMYRAKQLRTGFEVHDDSLTEEYSQLRVLTVLRQALSDGTFELHYQPQVSLSDGHVLGLEALFRLPYSGSFLPTQGVIAAAGHAGLLGELTDAVIERSMAELKELLVTEPSLVLSLNVSENDFSSGTLPDRLLVACTRHGVSPRQICIEITEESLLHDAVAATRTVNALRGHGMTVSMDDFGVGFSSLTNLRLLEVDELKVDRSFVTGMVDHGRTEALLVSIVDMARRLGSTVLIEGIEHKDEVRIARQLGIDAVQGYVFARPMPFDQVRTWIRQSETERLAIVGLPGQPATAEAADTSGLRRVPTVTA